MVMGDKMNYSILVTLAPRALTPEEGQNILKEMREAVPINATVSGWNTIDTPGNLKRIDFPDWLRGWLDAAKFQFDTINWMYHMRVQERKDADAVIAWFDKLREWAKQNAPEKAVVLARVDVKIYDAAEVAEDTF
jgi:hypothetical protein